MNEPVETEKDKVKENAKQEAKEDAKDEAKEKVKDEVKEDALGNEGTTDVAAGDWEVGKVVKVSWPRNPSKEYLDGFQGDIIAVLTKKMQLQMLDGPRAGKVYNIDMDKCTKTEESSKGKKRRLLGAASSSSGSEVASKLAKVASLGTKVFGDIEDI